MAALLALICFVLGLFGVVIEHVNWLYLGLAFVALHLLFDWRPWAGRGR